jgi:hypothetical protein
MCTSTKMHAILREEIPKWNWIVIANLPSLANTPGALENQGAFKSQLDELGQCVIENHGVIGNQNVGTYYQSKSTPLLVNSISPTNLLLLTYKMCTLRAPLICIFHLYKIEVIWGGFIVPITFKASKGHHSEHKHDAKCVSLVTTC